MCRVKIKLLVCVSFVLVGFSSCSVGDDWVFPFSSAMIEYDISGDYKGRERFYIDGEKEAREAVVVATFGGEKMPVQSRIVNTGPKRFFFLADGIKQSEKENVYYKDMKEMSFKDREYYYLTEIVLDGAVFNRVGKSVVLGKDCDLYKVEFGTLCVWNNVVLKKDVELMGSKVKMIARDIKIDVAVNPSVFKVD